MYVSTSIKGTEVTFNHIDEYDDSESENETEETSSSQLSHVLVGNDDHESPAELSFLTTRNSCSFSIITATLKQSTVIDRKYRHCKGNKSPETMTRPR